MKVSGFTIIRNAQIMDYPLVESIKSVLPLVDEFIVGLGPCEDNTEALIREINSPKIQIFHADWNTQVVSGGQILSEKTNEALARCSNNWCFYIQADEVIHEKDLPAIQAALEKHESDPHVQGLLFNYVHFYGSYDITAASRKWYRNEVRIVKKDSGVQSWRDAQGFRVHGEKPQVKPANARVLHYGWVKPPEHMREKKKRFDRLWHGDKRDQENDQFLYKTFYGLKKFEGTHPAVMQSRIQDQKWSFNPQHKLKNWTLSDYNCLLSDMIEKTFQYRIGEYKNYRLI